MTDTPEKEEIEERKAKKVKLRLLDEEKSEMKNVEEKTTKRNEAKTKDRNIIRRSRKPRNVATTSKAIDDSTSESEESFEADNSSESDFELEPPEKDFDYSANNVEAGDFLLVKFCSKTTLVHYIGRVEKELEEEYELSFLRKKGNGFIFPTVPDISCVQKQDVVLKLPSPCKSGGSSRIFSVLYFDVDLNDYKKLR